MSARQFNIRPADDFHYHLRRGALLKFCLSQVVKSGIRRIVAEPNTAPPIMTIQDVIDYSAEVQAAKAELGITDDQLEVWFLVQLTENTDPMMIYEMAKRAVELKIIGFKVYPYGVTTESKYGVKNYDKIDLCLQAIAAVNASVGKRFERPFIVQIHGEHPDFNVHFMDKEWNFLAIFSQKVIKFPDVKFSLEHISDHRSIELIKRLPDNAVGGIAIHHCIIWGNNIVYALDDQGHPHPALQPHNFCMPIAKRLEDMKAIVQAACSGSHKFSFQNDTAIHAKGRKETSCGCAGIYHGKFSLQLAAGLFDQMGKLDNLEIFTSINASRFYELPFNEGEITLVEEEETIPNEYSIPGTSDTVVPFMAGQKVKWQVRVPEPKPAAKAPSPPSIF